MTTILEFHGRFADFGGVDAYPRPLQRPIPLVVGGRTAPAHHRAMSRAHGWYGFALTPDETAAQLVGLRRAGDMVERPAALRELEISVTPRGRGSSSGPTSTEPSAPSGLWRQMSMGHLRPRPYCATLGAVFGSPSAASVRHSTVFERPVRSPLGPGRSARVSYRGAPLAPVLRWLSVNPTRRDT